jgi:hypothetical protein
MVNLKKLKNLNKVKHEQHPFHLVDPSPWPIMTSMSLWSLVLSFILYFHYFKNGAFHFIVSFVIFLFFLFKWFKDIIIEATFEGHHSFKVQKGIKLGMILFIASEVMFFFSFFWGFFHCSGWLAVYKLYCRFRKWLSNYLWKALAIKASLTKGFMVVISLLLMIELYVIFNKNCYLIIFSWTTTNQRIAFYI